MISYNNIIDTIKKSKVSAPLNKSLEVSRSQSVSFNETHIINCIKQWPKLNTAKINTLEIPICESPSTKLNLSIIQNETKDLNCTVEIKNNKLIVEFR